VHLPANRSTSSGWEIPRSQLYAEALIAYLGTHGAAAITAKLNAIYADSSSKVDPVLAQAQLRTLSREAW
jgi:hypothetical protein